MLNTTLRFFGLMRVSTAREINEEIAAADFRTIRHYLAEDAPHLEMREVAEKEHREWANGVFDQVAMDWENQDHIITELESHSQQIGNESIALLAH